MTPPAPALREPSRRRHQDLAGIGVVGHRASDRHLRCRTSCVEPRRPGRHQRCRTSCVRPRRPGRQRRCQTSRHRTATTWSSLALPDLASSDRDELDDRGVSGPRAPDHGDLASIDVIGPRGASAGLPAPAVTLCALRPPSPAHIAPAPKRERVSARGLQPQAASAAAPRAAHSLWSVARRGGLAAHPPQRKGFALLCFLIPRPPAAGESAPVGARPRRRWGGRPLAQLRSQAPYAAPGGPGQVR